MNPAIRLWSATCFALFTSLCGLAQYSARPQVAFDKPIRIAGVEPIGALKSEAGCRLEVRITVDRSGQVTKAVVVTDNDSCTDRELIAAAVAQAKEYRFNPDPTAPAHQSGTISWIFQEHGQSALKVDGALDLETEPVPEPSIQEDWYTFTDPMPQFPGGEEAFKAYLATNLRYPELERENSIQGTVYLSIIVEENGVVTNITPLREVYGGRGLTQEAIRVLKAMPAWTPGRMNGKPVRVKMNVPVKFRLE
ncbi:MAG: TonB family protein [Flavobacteriales bacterium]